MRKSKILIVSIFFSLGVLANEAAISFQGRIIKPDNSPLEGSAVQFRLQVRSPGIENCLLYEEVQSIDMSESSGAFSVSLNDGAGTRQDSATYTFERIFINRDTMTLDSSRCDSGTTYAPNSSDGRKLVVYFKDSAMSAYEPLPVIKLNFIPQAIFALEANKLGSFSVNNLLRTVDAGGNPVAAPALDPVQLTNLNSLLAGTSTQYATSAQFGSVQTFAKTALPTCGLGEVLKSNGTSVSCVTDSAGSSTLPSSGASAPSTIDSLNFSQIWNWSTATTQSPMALTANSLTTGSLMNITSSSPSLNSANGLVNVVNSSASTNGVLARFQSNSTSGSGLTILANGSVGIGTSAPQPNLKLQVNGAAASSVNIINTGGLVDLSLANVHYLKSVGGSVIDLSNMASGGSYTLIIYDATQQVYTFNGCTNSYFSPSNSQTYQYSTFSILTVVDGANTNCFINWVTGFN